MRDDTPCLLYKKQEEESGFLSGHECWTLDEECDLDYICSYKRIHYFKRDKNGDPAVFIHRGKCKLPTPIAYQTRTKLKQTDYAKFLIKSDWCIL